MNDHCIINPNSLYSTFNRLNTTTPDLTVLVKCIFNDKSANRTLEQLKEVELFKLRDFEGLTKGEFEESLLGVKPPKRRSALRVALLAVLPPLTDSGSFIVLALALAALLCCALLYGLPCVLLSVVL